MKNLILMLIACFFVMTNAQAQFKYTYSNGVSIWCENPPYRQISSTDYYLDFEKGIFSYMEVGKKSPDVEEKYVVIREIKLKDIDQNGYELFNSPASLAIRYKNSPGYQYRQEGKNTIVNPEKYANEVYIIHFENVEQLELFAKEMAKNLPNANLSTLNEVIKKANGGQTPKETNTTDKVVSKDEILKNGSTYSFKGKTCYKYKYAFYDSNFQEFGRVSGNTYRFGGVEMYSATLSGVVSKGTKVIAYCHMQSAFYDAQKSNLYIKDERGIFYKSIAKNKNEQFGTYKSSSGGSQSMVTIEDIVVLVNYFGL